MSQGNFANLSWFKKWDRGSRFRWFLFLRVCLCFSHVFLCVFFLFASNVRVFLVILGCFTSYLLLLLQGQFFWPKLRSAKGWSVSASTSAH
jgi:hypothetical protein